MRAGYTIVDTQGNNMLSFSLKDYERIWFSQNGSNLEVSLIGSTDKVTVQNLYDDESKLNSITAGDYKIEQGQVNLLVQAMASFNPPTSGRITDDPTLSAGLEDTLANLWQTRT